MPGRHPITDLHPSLVRLSEALTNSSELIRRIGEAALHASETHTPVRTGYLLSTEGVRFERSAAVLTATADYAKYVHAKKPFFAQGIQDAIPEFQSIAEAWASGAFDEAMK